MYNEIAEFFLVTLLQDELWTLSPYPHLFVLPNSPKIFFSFCFENPVSAYIPSAQNCFSKNCPKNLDLECEELEVIRIANCMLLLLTVRIIFPDINPISTLVLICLPWESSAIVSAQHVVDSLALLTDKLQAMREIIGNTRFDRNISISPYIDLRPS